MYRALYRKWRPQRFEDVVGQRAIVTALKNQITAGRVGHAYLFTGVRGTGKTTCAKIFAKAVNCLHPEGGDPCGKCEICKGIDNGSLLDVVEMDAASNNGVDDIRDLRDETAYTPSACQYKVYIIDEVHMLSTAAFNALLKTLEEPPAHVIFILATTEIQKVPATILSRCQRYDFTRIGPEDIARRVEYIAGEENAGADLRRRGTDRPSGRWRVARCTVHSGYLRRCHRKDRRRRGAPYGRCDRPQLPVPYFGRSGSTGRSRRAGTAGTAAAAVGGREAPDRGIDRPLPRPDAGGAARRAGAAVRCIAGGRGAVPAKRARRWGSEKPSAPSALWARRWST